MASEPANTDIASMSFEQALKELETIVNSLEQGNVALEASISHYERGELLREHCQKLLGAAEAKVEKIRLTADGKPAGTEPLDPQ
ncbi:MAG: exodeoxyribonuclease VII small subunit [Nitratireductor sp.]|nr:exodeoxyribonuclease VII small subunit [Nitratireductor sp.]MCB1459336.1 exodeoxyribonuclease VII small subunit [Nitratireductor sp.]